MGAELTTAEAFLTSRLSSDTAAIPVVTNPPAQPNGTLDVLVPGGIHSERVQTAPSGPYIMWSMMGVPQDVTSETGIIILSSPLYLVRVCDKTGDFSTLEWAAERMHQVLNLAPLQTFVIHGAPYTMRYCVRERPYSYVERFIDIERRQLGGYYRIWVQPY